VKVSLDGEAQLVVVVVCVKCLVNFGNMDFELDLVCLPLSRMNVSFGVNINCLTKSVTFSKRVDQVGEKFLTAVVVNVFCFK